MSTKTAPPRNTSRASRPSLFTVTVIAMVVLGVVAVVLSRGDRPEPADEVAPVEVVGSALPAFQPGAADGAVGLAAPSLNGQRFDGTPMTIAGGDGPTAVLFLAHWCPHCQREVDALVPWLRDGGLPDGVRLVAVSTQADAGRANYPPSSWLDRAGWEVPTLVDDGASSAGEAFGMYGTPFWVFLNADGTVAGRVSGELPVAEVERALTQLTNTTR